MNLIYRPTHLLCLLTLVLATTVTAPKWWEWQRWRIPQNNRRKLPSFQGGAVNRPVYKPPTPTYYPPGIINSIRPTRKPYRPFYVPRPPRPQRPVCRCGISNSAQIRGRIVGGKEVDPMAYPWVSHLTDDEGYFVCAATLVTDRHLVTAAHCLRRVEASELWATIGDHDRSRRNEVPSITVRVLKVLTHPRYDRASYDNDIAIVFLCRPVLTPKIRPICLPPPGPDLIGRSVVVTGWGKVDAKNFQSDKLHEVGVKIVSRDDCLRMPLEPFEQLTLTASMICAGVPEGGKDACQGDSGGPMMWLVRGRWVMVGIVSKGFGCAEPGKFGIYTRVDRFLEWILDVTRTGRRCASF